MKLAYWLIITGVALGLVDAAIGGRLYTESGLLKPINDVLPVNVGLALMLIGAGLLLWEKV